MDDFYYNFSRFSSRLSLVSFFQIFVSLVCLVECGLSVESYVFSFMGHLLCWQPALLKPNWSSIAQRWL